MVLAMSPGLRRPPVLLVLTRTITVEGNSDDALVANIYNIRDGVADALIRLDVSSYLLR